ncbi:hypothetical protein G6F40_017122 [Rhizopus arrhizus]|nr:hypothetical protein G6F40_017122 [Rhizopus arrhizus]
MAAADSGAPDRNTWKVITRIATRTSVTTEIHPAARSRSVRGAWPARAAPAFVNAENDALTPRALGMNRVASVQIAPTPITPAPMKRTCDDHRPVAYCASVCPAGMSPMAVRTGTAMPHEMIRPVNMARPATMPMR